MHIEAQTATHPSGGWIIQQNVPEYVPVNPSNRFGDVIWGKVRRTPRPPWTCIGEDGVTRDFSWVMFEASSSVKLVYKLPEDATYRLWRVAVD